MTMQRILACICVTVSLLCLGVRPTVAAPEDTANAIGMVTGPLTGTYVQIGGDISRMAKREGVNLIVKESSGSIDNITRISSAENAALGIVQSDVLGYLIRSQNPESARIAKNLRIVFPFYREEVHVLARRDIATFAGLNGKRVVVGGEGSGSWLTSMNLLSMMEVEPRKLLRLPPPEGAMAVLKGQADAMILVGGKPMKLFKNLEDLARIENPAYPALLDGVHFLPLDDPRVLKEYVPSTITTADYNFVTGTVPTAAVTSVLVSFNFSDTQNPYAQQRCEMLGKTAAAIRNNLEYLREHGHPKWREVDPDGEVKAWKPDPCVAHYAVSPKDAVKENLEKDLLKDIQKRW